MILNSDGSTVSIVATSPTKVEGNSGTSAFAFRVGLKQAGVTAQSVSQAVTGSGTNPAGASDFEGELAGAVTSFAGETSKTVTMQVSGDTIVESDENFAMTLRGKSEALALGVASASNPIQDNDRASVHIYTEFEDIYTPGASLKLQIYDDERNPLQLIDVASASGIGFVSVSSAPEGVSIFWIEVEQTIDNEGTPPTYTFTYVTKEALYTTDGQLISTSTLAIAQGRQYIAKGEALLLPDKLFHIYTEFKDLYTPGASLKLQIYDDERNPLQLIDVASASGIDFISVSPAPEGVSIFWIEVERIIVNEGTPPTFTFTYVTKEALYTTDGQLISTSTLAIAQGRQYIAKGEALLLPDVDKLFHIYTEFEDIYTPGASLKLQIYDDERNPLQLIDVASASGIDFISVSSAPEGVSIFWVEVEGIIDNEGTPPTFTFTYVTKEALYTTDGQLISTSTLAIAQGRQYIADSDYVTLWMPENDIFTESADTVDFNNLTSEQLNAIALGADTSNALGGDDEVALSPTTGAFGGGAGNDVIRGSTADDVIDGDDGDDTLSGEGGDDQLTGGAGDDELTGGAGDDALTGGDGRDTFIIDAGSDTISDFTVNEVMTVDDAASVDATTQAPDLEEGEEAYGSATIGAEGTADFSNDLVIGDGRKGTFFLTGKGVATFSEDLIVGQNNGNGLLTIGGGLTVNVSDEASIGLTGVGRVAIGLSDTETRLIAEKMTIGGAIASAAEPVAQWRYASVGQGTLAVGDNGYVAISEILTLQGRPEEFHLVSIDRGGRIEVGGAEGGHPEALYISQTGRLVGHGSIQIDDGSEIANFGTIEADDGTLVIHGDFSKASSGGALINDQSTLQIDGAFYGAVRFVGPEPTGKLSHETTLRLDKPQDFHGTVEGLKVGDTIAISLEAIGAWLGGGVPAHVTVGDGGLEITGSNGITKTIKLSGITAGDTFSIRPLKEDSSGTILDFGFTFQAGNDQLTRGMVSESGNEYIDSLIWGWSAWNPQRGVIKYWEGSPDDVENAVSLHGQTHNIKIDGAGIVRWEDVRSDALVAAVETYASVSNVRFQRAETLGEADIVFWLTPLAVGSGESETPAETDGGQLWVYISSQYPESAFQFGGEARETILHELGHALGLAHSHDGGIEQTKHAFPGVRGEPGVDFSQDQTVFTVMSYNSGWNKEPTGDEDDDSGHQAKLGALDIAALQHLYGASDYNPKDNYQLPKSDSDLVGWFSIWDTGSGADTIVNGGEQDSTIDLRAATLVYDIADAELSKHAGGYVSWIHGVKGGFTIAHGVIIENATGGAGIDLITGNSASNIIKGEGGDDVISGGDGRDQIEGGGDNDEIYGEDGDDLLYGEGGEDQLYGGDGDDLLFGGDDDDKLFGGDGRDILDGGGGNNQLTGGAGADIFVVGRGSGTVGITDFRVTEGDTSTAIGRYSMLPSDGHAGDKLDLSSFEGVDFRSLIGGAVQIGAKTVLDLGNGSLIELDNFSMDALQESAVLFQVTASISAAGTSEPEGNVGTTAHSFVLSLSRAAEGPVTLDWSVHGVGDDAASMSDFIGGVLPSGSVTFAAGETMRTILVEVAADSLVEADEAFVVSLSNPSSGVALGNSSASGTILNDDSASVSIAALSAAKAEENSGTIPFTFEVTLSQAGLATQTVDWTVTGTGEHAAEGADFVGGVLPSGTVTLAAGEISQTITLPVLGDTIVEFDDFFLVTLSNPTPGLALATASALGVAQNDDRAIISIAPLSASKAESDSGTVAFTFTVSLDQASFAAQTADWTVTGAGSNAADAADFGGVLPSGTVSFAAGETSQVVTIFVSGDTAAEFNEDFAVTLSNLTFGLLLGVASATGTVLNDDKSVVSVTAGPGSNAEGNGGTSTLAWTVSLDRAGVTSQTVAWVVSGSGAHAADGTDLAGGVLPSGTLTFAPGETTRTVTVDVAGDTTVEFDEGLALSLSAPSSGLDLGTALMGGTILNDDLSAVSIAAQSPSKAEGNSGTTDFTFAVTLNQAGVSNQTVNWKVTGTGANAADAADFGGALPVGTVTFTAGETSKLVTIQVAGDSVGESHEAFLVSLSNLSPGLEFGTATASGTILDDDGSVSIAITQPAAKAEGNSGGTTAFTFTVTTTGDASTTRSVAWAVTGTGTSKADAADFAGGVLPAGVLTFAANETSKVLTITVNGDTTVEPDEGFVVSLSNPSSSLKIGTGSAGGMIQNDDSLPVTVTAHDDAYIVLEGQSLTIAAASGVLFNDQSASGASLLANAGHGAAQLAGTGAFTYTPTAGFTGVDAFTYHAVPGGNGVDGKAVLYVVPVNTGGASTTLDLLGLTAAEQIAATYTAFFGRAADAGGHSFWVGEFIQHLPTQGAAALFANIASSFGISAEAKALYPFLASPFTATDAQISAFLDSVYNNLFNRSSDAGGLAYWTGEIKATLQAGKFVGSVLVNIMSGAQDTAAGKDITTLMGKVAVSLEYVHEQQEHGTPWRGASDVAAATALLETVTADPSSVLVGIRNAETLVAAHA